jgi:hypothetical protein
VTGLSLPVTVAVTRVTPGMPEPVSRGSAGAAARPGGLGLGLRRRPGGPRPRDSDESSVLT